MSQKTCQVSITRGKNVGKMCYQIKGKCRHEIKTCPKCNKCFNRDDTYFKHARTCNREPVVPATTVPTAPIAPIPSDSNVLREIQESVRDLHKLLADSARTPVIINNTVNYQHITISDIGAFKILCDKMGINEATDFLCNLATKPKAMILFEKLFLECDPASYPIANNNGHDLYYRDEDDRIVHDAGGHKIAELGERLMKNAFIEAADPLLTRFIKQNVGDHDGDDDDYDKFRKLQNGASGFKVDRSFIKELYPKTYNPHHTFFSSIRC